ncbi:Pentatricopeptide repeat [Parasponia andersonii]|uniref:Pentatricopeptide repeat n=1 Tax=Parasponia andersonii TaxID=3476 RepID=A0A2P5CRM8_PARAD|nr:Pentatricopeptide repeat [Parasponia andersonii]
MYVLCESFLHAKNKFHHLELGLASPWNWMIRGFTMMGLFKYALMFNFKMLGYGTSPDKYIFPPVIKACGSLNNVSLEKQVHERIRLMGLEVDVGSSLIKLYAENGCIDDARNLFDKMPQRDRVLWNIMFNGYMKNGDMKHSVEMFLEMTKSDVKPNSKFGDGTQDSPPKYHSGSDCLHSNDFRNGEPEEAIDLFRQMGLEGTKYDCVSISAALHGKEIHGFMIRRAFSSDILSGKCPDRLVRQMWKLGFCSPGV